MNRPLLAIALTAVTVLASSACREPPPPATPKSGVDEPGVKGQPAAPEQPTAPADKPAEVPKPEVLKPEKQPVRAEAAADSLPAVAGEGTVQLGAFSMKCAPEWATQPANGTMRLARFTWPKADGDDEEPELIAFFFGVGGGGPVDENIDRWRKQFVEEGEPAPGSLDAFETNSLRITLLDKSGTYMFKERPMAEGFTPKPGWRLLGAVVELEGGPLFFRATGPDASVAAQRDALIAALKTIAPRPS